MLTSSKFVRGLMLCALPVVVSACGSDFVPPIGETNADALTFSCDPDSLPGSVGEFQIVTFQNALGSVDPDSVEVRLNFVSGVPDGLTLTPASGSVIPLGAQTVTVEVTDCSFESADLRFLVDVIGRDLVTGELVTRSFSGVLSVTNQNVVAPALAAPSVVQQLAEAMTMREFEQWPPRDAESGNESFGAMLVDLDDEALKLAFDPSAGLLPVGENSLGTVHGSDSGRVAESGRFVMLWSAFGADSLMASFDGDVVRGSVVLAADGALTNELEGLRSSWIRLVERSGVRVLLVPVPGVEELAFDWAVGPFGPSYSIGLR